MVRTFSPWGLSFINGGNSAKSNSLQEPAFVAPLSRVLFVVGIPSNVVYCAQVLIDVGHFAATRLNPEKLIDNSATQLSRTELLRMKADHTGPEELSEAKEVVRNAELFVHTVREFPAVLSMVVPRILPLSLPMTRTRSPDIGLQGANVANSRQVYSAIDDSSGE